MKPVDQQADAKALYNTASGFFGVKLDHEAPIPVCDCIAFIRSRGLYDVGVFRVTGSVEMVNKLKEKYDKTYKTQEDKETKNTSILNDKKLDPSVNDVASLMKAFFKDLESPLIPVEIGQEMMNIVAENLSAEEEVKKLSTSFKKIPSPNRECLGFLISFLRELCTFKRFNQMGSENVATCFVLSIMGGENALDQLHVIGKGAVVIKKLITTPVRLYMPSITSIRANTKFTDEKSDSDKLKNTRKGTMKHAIKSDRERDPDADKDSVDIQFTSAKHKPAKKTMRPGEPVANVGDTNSKTKSRVKVKVERSQTKMSNDLQPISRNNRSPRVTEHPPPVMDRLETGRNNDLAISIAVVENQPPPIPARHPPHMVEVKSPQFGAFDPTKEPDF